MVWALVVTARRALSGANATAGQRKVSGALLGVTHLQLILGLVLYGLLSPITTAAMSDMKAAMGDTTLRFWAVEHIFGMVLGVVFVQLGFSSVKAAFEQPRRNRRAAIFFGLALLFVVASIPWPGRPGVARPLLRSLSSVPALSAATERVSDVAEDAADAAGEITEEAVEAAGDAAGEARDRAKGAMKKVVE